MKRKVWYALIGALLVMGMAVTAAFADDSVEYVVKPGDTLSKIAREHGTTVNAIAVANGISNRNIIFPGEMLIIPSPNARVFIDSPTNGQMVRSPMRIAGRSNTFEAVVNFHVLDRNLRVVGSGLAMGGAGTLEPFAGNVSFSVPFAQVGYVEAFEVSAKDGSLLQTDTVRVLLTPSRTTGTTRYVVRFGDTLFSIARRFGTTVAKLAQANNIANVNRIFAGQVLIIVR